MTGHHQQVESPGRRDDDLIDASAEPERGGGQVELGLQVGGVKVV